MYMCASVYMHVCACECTCRKWGEERKENGEGKGVENGKGECLTNNMSDSWCHSQNAQMSQ